MRGVYLNDQEQWRSVISVIETGHWFYLVGAPVLAREQGHRMKGLYGRNGANIIFSLSLFLFSRYVFVFLSFFLMEEEVHFTSDHSYALSRFLSVCLRSS